MQQSKHYNYCMTLTNNMSTFENIYYKIINSNKTLE